MTTDVVSVITLRLRAERPARAAWRLGRARRHQQSLEGNGRLGVEEGRLGLLLDQLDGAAVRGGAVARVRTRDTEAGAGPGQPPALAGDGPQHPGSVAEGPQMAVTVDPRALERGDLDDAQTGGQGPDVQERLHLEAGHTRVEGRQHVPPEGHVAVAEIGVAAAEGDPDRLGQHEVAERPQRGQVAAATALQETGALGHVGAGVQRGDEGGDVVRIHRPVGVHHHQDVAAGGVEAGLQGDALAGPLLQHDGGVGTQLADDVRRSRRWSRRPR